MNSCLPSSAAALTEFSIEQTGLLPAALAAPVEEAVRGRGRPPMLTGELAAKMYKLIRVYGLTDSRAGLLAGASTSSVSRWKEEDPEFRDYLETARAEFEVNRTRKLLEAVRPDGAPDWRAHAWLLKNSQRGEERPREECAGVPVSECAGEPGGAPSSAGTPGGEVMRQKIPENGASSIAHAPAMGRRRAMRTRKGFPKIARPPASRCRGRVQREKTCKRFPKIAAPPIAQPRRR